MSEFTQQNDLYMHINVHLMSVTMLKLELRKNN